MLMIKRWEKAQHFHKELIFQDILFFPLFGQLIKHFQLDAHFVEEAGESAVNQLDDGSEEEETEVDENQCSGGAHENDGDDDCDGDGGDDSVNDEAMEIFQV